jgi:carbamate kinase
MLVAIALGGNALLRRGEPMTPLAQRRNVSIAADAIANIAKVHRLVVTHGTGPQIGLLAERSAPGNHETRLALDVLGAETQGMIGYIVESELALRLPNREIATLITQVVVDPSDPAFRNPSKPIGRIYPESEIRRLEIAYGWRFVADGQGFRRAVPSPMPRSIREINAIRILVDAGVLVICAGGGGIPVAVQEDSGAIVGIEAVVDKDRSAALLACELKADALLMLTDVPAVCTEWGGPSSRPIRRATPAGLRRHRFLDGSMGPKVEAACAFVAKTGGIAAIGALTDASAMLIGEAGTLISTNGPEMAWY